MLEDKIKNFSSEIFIMIKEKDMDYIDAVIYWCEVNKIEIELAASLIKLDPTLLYEIQFDAENLNYLKKTARLPL